MKKKKGLMKKQKTKTEHEDEKGGSGWVAGMSPQKQEHRRMSALLATEPERFRYNSTDKHGRVVLVPCTSVLY